MASFHLFGQHNQSQFESPAKIFAKLKFKVQREAARARENQDRVREQHGGDFNRKENFCLTEELKRNIRTRAYRSEAQSLTLSPVSTPHKNYSNFGGVDEPSLVSEHGFTARHHYTPTKKHHRNSTAVFQPLPNKERPQAPSGIVEWTPSKSHHGESGCVRGVYEEDGLMSPSKMILTYPEVRLRKRKWEPHKTYRVSDSGKVVGIQAPERKTSTEDKFISRTPAEDVSDATGFPPGVNPAPMFTSPRPTPVKRCIALDNGPPMSPAKLFALMKAREYSRDHQADQEVSSSTRKLFNGDEHFHQERDSHVQTPHDADDAEDTANGSVPDSHSREESVDSQSDPLEDPPIPAAMPPPVLLEDSLVLNSPKINMPKKNPTVFKCNKWQQLTFPDEGDIYLKKWFLRKNKKGLFLDGIHIKDNIPWNSNIVADRVSNSVVKTVSGKVYVLLGKMSASTDSEFPKWFLKKFVNGFPPNWKSLYEKCLTEESVRTSKGNSTLTKTRSQAPAKQSVKQTKQNTFKTPESCPPALFSSSCPKTSRSGRLIKPPLEYWKGGRVILDADMNVTIHECYETSVCISEVSPPAPAKKSQGPLLLCSEGRKRSETACSGAVSAPVRKVKAPLRRRDHCEPPVDTMSSPEEAFRRRTRSQSKSPPLQKTLDVDTGPQRWKETKKAAKPKSKKQTRETKTSSERRRKRTSPTAQDKTLSSIERKNQWKVPKGKSGWKSGDKSQAGGRNQSSRSSASSEEEKRKSANAAQTHCKQSKHTKAPLPTMPMSKPTHSTRTHKSSKGSTREQDEDEWTEAELTKLQEAVSHYPKHTWGFWGKVAKMVGSRSAEECHNQHTSQGVSQSPVKKTKKPRKDKKEVAKDPVTDCPIVSAGVGTLRRKQQVRQLLQALPTEDVDDVFSSTGMQKKCFQMSSLCPNEIREDHDIQISDLEPLTPMSSRYPELRTPQCLHITPGMMGSPDMDNDDKYIYHLQKRMKRNRFNVCKQPQLSKRFTPTPSAKRTMRRCGNTENDTFVVWEMFPGKEAEPTDSEEEQDFYFSDT